MEKINIRGVLFNNTTLEEADGAVRDYLSHKPSERAPLTIFTPNSEIVQVCIENPELYGVINSASIIIPDGAGVVLASKILGVPLRQKVAGIDLSERILAALNDTSGRLFLLGAKEETVQLAAKKISEKYPKLIICGINNGYFNADGDENNVILEKINAAAPDAVFVCLGAPRQEKWIHANLGRLPPALYIGLGGTFENIAGKQKRAPDIFIKLNLEWFYRLLKEPYRIGRMMKLPKFIFGTVAYKITGQHG